MSALLLVAGCASTPAEDVRGPRYTPTSDYETRVVEGWTLRVNRRRSAPVVSWSLRFV